MTIQLDLFDQPAPPPEPPLPAHQRHSSTSRAAAESVRDQAATLREKVFNAIEAAGERGLTDSEMQAALKMEGSTQRPRRELELQGRIMPSGGPSHPVWVTLEKWLTFWD